MSSADGGFLLPPGLETVPLDMAVLTVLLGEFGWVSSFAVTKRLAPDLQNEKNVEASLKRLAKADKILSRERYGNVTLFRALPRPGEEATAEVRPDPTPRVIQYTGPESDEIPAPRPRGKTLTIRIAPKPLIDKPFLHKLAASIAAAPTTQETTMRINQNRVLEQLAKGPHTVAQLAAALQCKQKAATYHLKNLAANKKAREDDAGTWSLLNGHASPAPRTTRPAADVAVLRWSVGNDGSVTFKVGDTSIDVAGDVLERVQRARQAILEAA